MDEPYELDHISPPMRKQMQKIKKIFTDMGAKRCFLSLCELSLRYLNGF